MDENEILLSYFAFLLPIKLSIFSEGFLVILIFFPCLQNLFTFSAQFLLGVLFYGSPEDFVY